MFLYLFKHVLPQAFKSDVGSVFSILFSIKTNLIFIHLYFKMTLLNEIIHEYSFSYHNTKVKVKKHITV